MQKFNVTQADHGVSECDENLGLMWSDHCIHPFVDFEIVDGVVHLLDKNGEHRGTSSLDMLEELGEAC